MSELFDRLKNALSPRYTIERDLGSGGMATVYLARDVKHDRYVAVKVLRHELALAVGTERFLREIKVTARLRHPYIVALLDSGQVLDLPFCVMEYVKGESLRTKLKRETQLGLDETIRIAHDVADALDAAHREGVVHRDIKPGNILLGDGHAMVSDFGIAKVLSDIDADELTASGFAIGTPGYMAPEQAAGQSNLDGRSDVYSLGCVVFEMLAGEPPYTGRTADAIIRKQLAMSVPHLTTVRETIPAAVNDAIRRALAKVPADRFDTAGEFATALEKGKEKPPPPPMPPVVKWLIGSAAAVASIAAVVAIVNPIDSRVEQGLTADTTSYVILPFNYHGDVEETLHEVERLSDALSRWDGLVVVDQFRVREQLAERGTLPLTQSDAAEVARNLGAGRYIRGEISRVGDSLRVSAGVYRADDNGTLLQEDAFRLMPQLRGGVDLRFAKLVDRLLFRELFLEAAREFGRTRSLPALQSFARGRQGLKSWDLPSADSAFSRAAEFDPEYAEAHLWVALVRSWAGAQPAQYRFAAERSALGRSSMSTSDQLIADAVAARARGDYGRACSQWDVLTQRDSNYFVAWYGLADCLASDQLVLPEERSRSGWRFRTSYHRALSAYERAFWLRPSILASLRGESWASVRHLFHIAGNQRRVGYAQAPDESTFTADPSWQGDTLVFMPYRVDATTPLFTDTLVAVDEALRRLRGRFRDMVVAWVTSSPQSPDAMEALALSLAMLENSAALDTLNRARALARDSPEQIRIAGTQVWMQLIFSIPYDSVGLRRARTLADSLLAAHSPGSNANAILLAALAAVTGRAELAVRYALEPPALDVWGAPAPLRRTAPALLLYSALGGPVDSLDSLEQRITEAIDDILPPSQRLLVRSQWAARAATLAFPVHRFATLASLARTGDYLLDLQVDLLAGDTTAVVNGLLDLRETRRPLAPATITIDQVYPEAALLVELGDLPEAARWLDRTFDALPQVAPHVLGSPVRAASLVRAMALRATIAQRLGDSEGASLWASAVIMLWQDADPFLQRIVSELIPLVR